MQKFEKESVQQVTVRVKKRLPIEKIREIPNYKEITPEAYDKLIKDAETIALLILETFMKKESE